MEFNEDQKATIINHATQIALWIAQYDSDTFSDCTEADAKQMAITMISRLATYCVINHPICFENDGAMLDELQQDE